MLVAVELNFSQPVLNVVEGLLLGDVVDQESANSTAVVGARDGSEVLLSCGVPDLQLDVLVVYLDGLGPEFHPDGDIVRETCLVLDELQHNARLSDA